MTSHFEGLFIPFFITCYKTDPELSPFKLLFDALTLWFLSSDELMEEPVKRHSDAIFTDNYSRFRKQMAVKKYLNSVLTGKRR